MSSSATTCVVHYISDRVMVMYLGQVAEIGPSDALFASLPTPTPALLSSVPSMDHRTQQAPLAATRPTHQPTQRLPLHPRCPKAARSAQRCPASPRCSCTTARAAWCTSPAAAIRWPRRPAAFLAA
jgi:ABC-type oligopeptide transport system ATPase subunit